MIGYESLNMNQRRALEWHDGPLLVLAGPGSGKTEVLTLRVVRTIEKNEHASVLALTFTNVAAAAMRERVGRMLGESGERVHLCTFHSFAAEVLRQHGSHLGLQPDFSLLTQDEDRIAILEMVIAQLEEHGNSVPMDRKNLLSFVDRLFAESYDGGGVVPSLAITPPWVPLLYEGYCKALVDGNRLDFGSLIHFARRLIEETPGVGRVLRLGWTSVCVDEFQDTNRAQYDLLRLIVPVDGCDLFVVADDDQIIYQWNGASPQRLDALRRDYRMAIVQLPECYRCPAPVVAYANLLISHNLRRVTDKLPISSLATTSVSHGVVRCRTFRSPKLEAEFIAHDLSNRNLIAEDCVVLGRMSRLVNEVAVVLQHIGQKAHVARRKNDFESSSVRVLVEALRLANARHDRAILRRLCIAWRDLSGITHEPESIAAAAALVGGDYLRAWTEAATNAAVGRSAGTLERIKTHLVDSLAFPDVVDWFIDEGWRSWIGDDDLDLMEDEIATWNALHKEITVEYGRTVTLHSYLMQFDLASKATRPAGDSLRCMTVHGAKGLEFKHVYLVGMAQEVFPSFQALREGPQSRQMEEERRSCFVAITRAQETLTMTRSQCYFGYSKRPSQFLHEMGASRDCRGPRDAERKVQQRQVR